MVFRLRLFDKCWKWLGRRFLRRILRGYRILKKSETPGRIAHVKRRLTIQPLRIGTNACTAFLFGEGANQAELICRQYLISRLAGVNLNRVLLYSIGNDDSAVVFPLPAEWQKILSSHGFKVAVFRSRLCWIAYLTAMLGYGLLVITKIFFDGLGETWRRSNRPLGRYAYFDSLSLKNLPQAGKDGRSHDIITWYSQWAGREKKLDALCHGVVEANDRTLDGLPVVGRSKKVLSLDGYSPAFRFLVWGIKASLVAIWELLHGYWWHSILLKEAAIAAQLRLQKQADLARDYLFHNSGWIYRPMWTYTAEAKGSRILFYFYSTNCEPIKTKESVPQMMYGWEAMSWPTYLVWDEFQADFVRRAVEATPEIDTVGSIWFHSTNETELPTFNGRTIAVFDVTPVREAYYAVLGLEFEYYVPGICIKFLKDIRKAAEDCGCFLLWKRKRKEKAKSLTHPAYLSFSDHMSAESNVITIDPDISAYRVIEKSDIAISMPFTSTALIARELGKPSYFYDPTGLVQKNDKAAHAIEIITGYNELIKIMRNTATTVTSPAKLLRS